MNTCKKLVSEIDHDMNTVNTTHTTDVISKLRENNDIRRSGVVIPMIQDIPITNLQPVTPFDRRIPMWTYDDWLEEHIDVLHHLYNISLDVITCHMSAPLVDEKTDDYRIYGSIRTFDDFAYFMYSKTNKYCID